MDGITDSSTDPHQPLRHDIHLLGVQLGHVLKEQTGEAVFEEVERIRHFAKELENGNEQAFQDLVQQLGSLSSAAILPVTRAFAQFLNLANVAEQFHRVRRSRWHKNYGDKSAQPGSLEAALPTLIENGVEPDDLYKTVTELQIDLVLTAHPTEISRRTVIHKYNQITDDLEQLDQAALSPEERQQVIAHIHQQLTALWLTDEIRDRKPSPVKEAKWGFAVVERTIWSAIPKFLRDLDNVLLQQTGKRLPLETTPIRFGAWMGGDRDGNPTVTPEVTREAVLLSRWMAMDLYWREINALRDDLSMANCAKELSDVVGQSNAPYRSLLRDVRETIRNTQLSIEAVLNQESFDKQVPTYQQPDQLLEPLMLCYRSLRATGADCLADGHLLDIIRQVHCFGFSLYRLDCRQEASKHNGLMNNITQSLSIGIYTEWNEAKRQQFLNNILDGKQDIAIDSVQWEADWLPEWQMFTEIARLPRDSFGQYIISMASEASDVLLVMVLQKLAGIQDLLPVVPLFEQLADLEQAPSCMDALWSQTNYRKLINNHQEVMIGYSDSAKDAGILAASWAQYQVQEQLIPLAEQYGIKLRFFHGRGGSIGRGGGPTHMAIRSLPPGTIKGQLRVTQQGEVIRTRFGTEALSHRTLSVYTTAVLQAMLSPPIAARDEWRALMNDLSRVSANQFRRDIYEDPDFIQLFQQVTPVTEWDNLAIGSRPLKRGKAKGLGTLRAIPWVFAWTQNRLLLPAWLGVGEALQYAIETGREKDLLSMVNEWPFFRSFISMIEMVLAKAEPKLSWQYDNVLNEQEGSKHIQDFIKRFADLEGLVLKLLGEKYLLEQDPSLRRTILLRRPYLLPLNLLQVLLLQIKRKSDEMEPDLQQALLVTMVGIAAGMRNTG